MMRDIAIVGMSCRFCNVKDRHAFSKLHSIDKIQNDDETLMQRGRLVQNEKFCEYGDNVWYLKDIDMFDYRFFKISKREAKRMAPEIKIALEDVVNAIYDAGISLKEIAEKETGILIAHSNCGYSDFIQDKDVLSFTGNLSGMTAGYLSYYLNMRGPALLLDSTCSSSAMCVWQAAQYIMTGQVDIMLAGGVEVVLQKSENVSKELKSATVNSPTMTCTPFDEKANGMVPSEGSGFVVLMPLDEAVKNNCHIYGVIKGGAVEANGSRSNTMTTPNTEAQESAIRKSWKMAGITGDEITDIEAHGTATKIGDPIEISAFVNCLKERTCNNPIAVSSIKSYIGHTGNVSGIAGLISVLSSFEENSLYGIYGFANRNERIEQNDFLSYNCKGKKVNPHTKRIASVNSLGFSGLNVHMVVENYPVENCENDLVDESNRLVVIGGKSESAFLNNAMSIVKHLESFTGDINDYLYTLNIGRDFYSYRKCIYCENKEQLIQTLKTIRVPDKMSDVVTETIDIRQLSPMEIMDAYHAGKYLDWSEYYKEKKYRRIAIPGYSFDQYHTWITE